MKETINKAIQCDSQCRIHFKDSISKLPLFGKFVACSDSAELAAKGMVRWVNEAKMDNFMQTKSTFFTRILTISTLQFIKVY
jgi:hypothetical protein